VYLLVDCKTIHGMSTVQNLLLYLTGMYVSPRAHTHTHAHIDQ